jgi:LysW-gamma-L-lysine/LysW-L-ornithine aminotransferase
MSAPATSPAHVHDLAWIRETEDARQPALYAKRDIALVRGAGAWLYDTDGKRYLDAMSNYGVASLGHADPGFAEALAEQLRTLATGHQSFYNDARADFLDEVARIAPEGLTRSFISNSGAEGIEAALKFARAATGRARFVALKRAYHGRTLGALAATADPKYRGPFEPLAPEVIHVPFDDAAALEAAVDESIAAVVLEPIQGEGGIHPAGAEYLQAARVLTRDRGALLIADEIQTGFRTGAPWAISHAGVVPDILVTAKALANGFPIGLTLMTEAVGSALPAGAHGSTFGGNPLVCRAGAYTLRAYRERGIYEKNAALGEEIVAAIRDLGSPKVRAVRGRGLMIGVELKERVTPTLRALQDAGVLVLPAGPVTFRLLPPLIWDRAHAELLMTSMRAVLN